MDDPEITKALSRPPQRVRPMPPKPGEPPREPPRIGLAALLVVGVIAACLLIPVAMILTADPAASLLGVITGDPIAVIGGR